MPTHAEVIALNPLEAPAPFWDNVYYAFNGFAAFLIAFSVLGSFVLCCLRCITAVERWEESRDEMAKKGQNKEQGAKSPKSPKAQQKSQPAKHDGNGHEEKNDKKDKKNDEIETLRETLAEARENIGVLSSPLKTWTLFISYTVTFTMSFIGQLLRSPVVWLLVVPVVSLWIAAKRSLMPELFVPPVCGETDGGSLWQVELYLKEAAWWIILGILSSVGFGTGLHSGLMFLFPHVMQVVGAAEACHTTTGLIPWYQHPCKLECSTTSGPKDDATVTMLRLWALVTVQCILWGAGTAIGELPPYYVSRAARTAGRKDSDFEKELEDARNSNDLFSRMKVWTIDFTERNGFVGVFLLAAWPNAAFDMCGMCCGYLLMPFWTFFLACACGKGLVKVNLQALFFVNLFGSGFFQVILSAVDSVNGALLSTVGKDFDLRSLAVKGRTKLVLQFESQSRFLPDKILQSSPKGLDLAAVTKLFQKFDGSEAVAARVLKEWDTDGDGTISGSELQLAASRTDGKISLSSLDPGVGEVNILKTGWELFIVGLVCYFLLQVVVQGAKLKQAEYDEAEVEKLQKKNKKK